MAPFKPYDDTPIFDRPHFKSVNHLRKHQEKNLRRAIGDELYNWLDEQVPRRNKSRKHKKVYRIYFRVKWDNSMLPRRWCVHKSYRTKRQMLQAYKALKQKRQDWFEYRMEGEN